VSISAEETDYLLAVVNAHFKQQLSRADVLHSFSGVQVLREGQQVRPVDRDNRNVELAAKE
jgi:glycerol-3-phosphate dehydrogenase